MIKSNRFWFIVLGAVLLVSVAAVFLLRQAPPGVAVIYQDGEFLAQYDLINIGAPIYNTLESSYGYNVITIEQGRVRISEADCPDKSCVRQGWVSGGAVPLVCLPHRLVIRFEGGGHPGLDAIVG